MTPAERQKCVRKYAKALAKAEWERFVPQAEAGVQAMMIDPEAAPLLEGKVRFKVRNHVVTER